MKNITKNMFLLGSALTVCVHYTRGDDYNPDYRNLVKREIWKAYSKEVDDFIKRNKIRIKSKDFEPMCHECADRMTKIVEECVKDYKKDNNVQTVHENGDFLKKFEEVLDKDRRYSFHEVGCGFAELPDSRYNWPIPSQAIEPALELLDVCDRFAKQYGCEMHAMHTRMMDPKHYLEKVSLDVLRDLISGYKRVSKKAAIWESCHNCRPSWDELKKSRDALKKLRNALKKSRDELEESEDELEESEDELEESEDELEESMDELEERGRVWEKWNKPMCEFLKSQEENKSEKEIFDAFVGYYDAAPWHYWNGPSPFFSVFQGDWWAEPKLVNEDDSRVNQENKKLYFKKTPAWQFYRSAFTNCQPTKDCNNDFKLVAKKVVEQCKERLTPLYNELKEENLNSTLAWFLKEVLRPRVKQEKEAEVAKNKVVQKTKEGTASEF